jgi:hypothetical protein
MLPFVGIALACCLCGCMENTVVIELNKDGSGTIVTRTFLSENMLETMARARDGAPPLGEPRVPLNREACEQRAAKMGQGVRLLNVEPVARPSDGARGVKVVYEFDDITAVELPVEPEQPEGTRLDPLRGRTRADPIAFRYTPGDVGHLLVIQPFAASAGAEEASKHREATPSAEETNALRKAARGMRFRMVVKVKGHIVSTNASSVHTRKGDAAPSYITIFDLNFEELLSNEAATKQMSTISRTENVSKAMTRFRELPGIMLEPEQWVEVAFR